MDGVFVLSNKAASVSGHMACNKAVADLMRRQSIPLAPSSLRALNDSSILRIAMMASVASISSWKRDASTNTLFQLSETGRLVHPYTPNAVETDVMLCIICVLLLVIAIFHLTAPPS